MSDPVEPARRQGEAAKPGFAVFALEVCFLLFLFLVVLAAFIEAFQYAFVSARTPFVIMVPLLALIAFQGLRLTRGDQLLAVVRIAVDAVSGRNPAFNKLFALSLSFVGLALMIEVFGHYIGIGVFMFFLMRVMGKEKLQLSLIVAVIATAVIYFMFEKGFHIELYRGLFFRYLQGYHDF